MTAALCSGDGTATIQRVEDGPRLGATDRYSANSRLEAPESAVQTPASRISKTLPPEVTKRPSGARRTE
jgi:hypothetical protein